MASYFTHLHCHSNYSLLDGTIKIESLIDRAKSLKMKSLVLTDHNNLYGAVEFYEKCLAAGIKPVIGAEITLDDGSSVILLAKNRTGYYNLCRIITEGNLKDGHLKFNCGRRQIMEHHTGLIMLSGGKKGQITRLLTIRKTREAMDEAMRWKKVFGEDFYLEMQNFSGTDKVINYKIYDIAKSVNVPLAATNNIHLMKKQDVALRQVLHAIDRNTIREKIDTTGWAEQYFKTGREMKELFNRYPDAVDNTQKIAAECSVKLQLNKPVFPALETPPGETVFSLLWKACMKGVKKFYKPLREEVMQRLNYELQVINDLGFAEYFLIVQDIVNYCLERKIPCVGRGSAGDSLVSYVLGITKMDPLEYDLYFERFLNPERTEPPDIDLDLCWRRRDDVIQYVYEKYGRRKTAMISTFVTFQLRSAVADVAKTFGLPEDELRALTKGLPYNTKISSLETVMDKIPELHDHPVNTMVYKEIFDAAEKITGFPRHLSIHSGGVIIAPDEITKYTPLEESGKGIIISQHDMYSIQKLGLVKMDLLGVRMLSILSDCMESVGIKNWDDIPQDDQEVMMMIRRAETVGCFQLESPGMRGLIKKMEITTLRDVIAAISIIRPGPAEGGMKDAFVRRRGGIEKTVYPHPVLRQVLKETYGVIVYQEQVLQVAHAAGGFTLGEADMLRRGITKKRVPEEMRKIKERFISGAGKKNIPEKKAQEIWVMLENFTGYGFNKAHSSTYGLVAYQSAYLKYHFPVQFMTAVLNNHGGFYSKGEYVEESRRLGIKILSPDVNEAGELFLHNGSTVRAGLSMVFELTKKTIKKIIEERENGRYKNLYDFLIRTRAGQKEAENLVKCGALRSLHKSEPELLAMVKVFYRNGRRKEITGFLTEGLCLPPYNLVQRVIMELEMLKFAVSAHPLNLFTDIESDSSIVPSGELEKYRDRQVKVAGWLVTSRRISVKKGGYMKFVTLEDKTGLIECVLFPEVYRACGGLLKGHGPFIVIGKVQSRLPGEANLIVDKLKAVPAKFNFEIMAGAGPGDNFSEYF